MNTNFESLLEEYLKRISLDTILKDDWILIEAIKRKYKEKVDAKKFIEELKRRYFDNEYKDFERVVAEIEKEYKETFPEKQLYYLAATVFAKSVLNKPVPASLVFEILRCVGMEDKKNYPNRYYFLEQLEKKNLVEKITVVNSRAEMLFCPTEEGRKLVDGTEALNRLIELKDEILSDPQVRKLIEIYSAEEPETHIEEPRILATSQVVSDGEVVRVHLYGREMVNLSLEEVKKIDKIARELGKFTQSELRKVYGLDKRAMAYLVYAYEKGWIRIAEKGPRDSVIFERVKGGDSAEINGDISEIKIS